MPHHDDNGSCENLISSYHELNASSVDELDSVPSALQFMRFVARNRPFIVRGGAKDWNAVKRWDAHYLRGALTGQQVRVAVTPKGNADAIVEDEHGRLLFAEPHEIHEPFDDFLRYVQEDAKPENHDRSVKYAQPQNDSLRQEYRSLVKDVPPDVSFATEALEKPPDAVNFWLGNQRSTTSLHKDNYENIYIQVRGKKLFTLLAPVEMPCVNETPVPFARYRPSTSHHDHLEITRNQEGDPIPVPIWDPEDPVKRCTKYSQYSRPLKVELNQSDMMYLPAMWYHKVGQQDGDEGFACSVNYWYDMDFSGSFWVANAFVRDVFDASLKAVSYPDLETVEIAWNTRD